MTPTFRRLFAAAPMLLTTLFAAGVARADDETTVPADAVTRPDVVYAARPTGPVKLDLFTPSGPGPFPLVLWIHGGAWKMGAKDEWPHMNFLVGQGYAVANVEYRFIQVAPFPAQLDDCTTAMDFLIAHAKDYALDPTRIAVTGESAGGHLAALLGMHRPTSSTQPAGVRAVIDLFGPTDLSFAAADPKLREVIEQLIGAPMAGHDDLVRQASPMTFVAAGNPPFLIMHGTKDGLVPFEQSTTLVKALKAAGVSAEFVPSVGSGHAGPDFWMPAMRERMAEFLKGKMK